MAQQKGFTLIELMIGLVIAGILMVLAVPSFRDYMDNNRAVTISNSFIAAIHLARSEAIKRGNEVSICSASDDTFSTCGAAGQWQNGWIVFDDSNNDGIIDNANERVKVYDTNGDQSQVTTTAPRVTFSSTGMTTSGANQNFGLQVTGCSGNNARNIMIGSTGRVSSSKANCSE